MPLCFPAARVQKPSTSSLTEHCMRTRAWCSTDFPCFMISIKLDLVVQIVCLCSGIKANIRACTQSTSVIYSRDRYTLIPLTMPLSSIIVNRLRKSFPAEFNLGNILGSHFLFSKLQTNVNVGLFRYSYGPWKCIFSNWIL